MPDEDPPPMVLAPIYAGRRMLWPVDTPEAVWRLQAYEAICTVWPVAFTAMGSWSLSGAQCARWAQTWQTTGATMAEVVQQIIAQLREAGWTPYRLPVHSTLHTQEDTWTWLERCMQLQGVVPPKESDMPAKKPTRTDKKVAEAFAEVHKNVPSTVKATGKTGAAKEKMLTAVALSKARAAGADIPEKPAKKRGSKASY